MPITTLDPHTALVIIDLQKGICSFPTAHPIDAIVSRTNSLAAAFRSKGLPVILVVVDGAAPGRTDRTRTKRDMPSDFVELLPELDVHPDDVRLSKRTPGAFAHTGLEAKLNELKVTQIVVVGISTSNGVESTARQAYELGFNVTLAVDAMTDGDLATHDYSINRIFPKLAETGTSQDIIELLEDSKR